MQIEQFRCPRPGRRRGYSLIELVMILGILAMLGAIAGPRYANSLALYRGQMAAQRIAADVALAQRFAKTTSAGQSIAFTVSSNSYSLPGVSGLSGSASTYNVNLASEPYTASLVSVNVGGGTTLSFDRYGQPGAGGTIVVKSGNSQRIITLDANSGAATIQ
jgi:type II secretory pathway pseudopilin PulG